MRTWVFNVNGTQSASVDATRTIRAEGGGRGERYGGEARDARDANGEEYTERER